MIPKPVGVKPVSPYSIWVKYADDTEGVWDLSYLLNEPIFKKWTNPDLFNKVHIDFETFSIAWDEDIELCADTLYLHIKGKTFEEWQLENCR